MLRSASKCQPSTFQCVQKRLPPSHFAATPHMTTISLTPPSVAAPALNPRIRRLIEEPILPTLLKLTAPNLADATARVAFLTLDAYFVSFLGSDALAGV